MCAGSALVLQRPLSHLSVTTSISQFICDQLWLPVYLLLPGLPGDLSGKESACNSRDLGSIPGWEDPLQKEMATHSGILA